VRLQSPLADAQVEPVDGIVMLSADVSDQVGLAKVEFWIDGKKIDERLNAPFTSLWQAIKGKHTLFLVAYDSAGNQTKSTSVSFTVLR